MLVSSVPLASVVAPWVVFTPAVMRMALRPRATAVTCLMVSAMVPPA